MTQLPIGPPTRPLTPLDPEGIAKIRNRLALVTDTHDFGDEMAPAVRSTVATLITQDLPSLLVYVVEHETAPPAGSIEEQIETRFQAAVEHLHHRTDDMGPRIAELASVNADTIPNGERL